MPPSWRDVSLDLYNIGKAMADIDQAIYDIRATGVVNDDGAKTALYSARQAARKLHRALDNLYSKVDET